MIVSVYSDLFPSFICINRHPFILLTNEVFTKIVFQNQNMNVGRQ